MFYFLFKQKSLLQMKDIMFSPHFYTMNFPGNTTVRAQVHCGVR